MLLGRPGWPAVQTEIVEALTFRGCCQSPRADGQPSPARASAWEMWQRGVPAAREKSLCRGWGRGPGETEGRRERPAWRTMESPWRPLGGQCVPRDPRSSAPGRRPCSSCLFRTRPCKCAHLILNPLRRSASAGGKGWPDKHVQISGLGTLVTAKCLHHACKWSRSLAEIGSFSARSPVNRTKQSLCSKRPYSAL